MNGFRIAILSLMAIVVALLSYVVFEVLPNKQREHEAHTRSANATDFNLPHAPAADATVVDSADANQEARESANAAVERVHANEEQRTLAQTEEQRRIQEEEEMAAQLAREAAEAEAIGMVTGIAPDFSFLAFKPLGDHQISEGLVIALRRGDDDYIICEGKVLRQHESGEWIADIISDSFFGSENADQDRPKPAEGDLVIVTPFDTADQLRGEAQSYPEAEFQPSSDGQ